MSKSKHITPSSKDHWISTRQINKLIISLSQINSDYKYKSMVTAFLES